MMMPECAMKKLKKRILGNPTCRFGVRTAWSVPPIPQKYATSNQRWLQLQSATITTTMAQSHICIGSIWDQVSSPKLRVKMR
jgi:hypothetical protein